MASEAQWTLEADKKFIALLREFPLLWDTSFSEYTNKTKREMTWKLLKGKMNVTTFELQDLKTRLYYYRRNYCEEYNKMINNAFYTTNFELFNALKFLFKHERENRSKVGKLLSTNSKSHGKNVVRLKKYQQLNDKASSFKVKDEFTIFGENIAKELKAMNKYNSIKLDFKYKVLAAILEANEALIKVNQRN